MIIDGVCKPRSAVIVSELTTRHSVLINIARILYPIGEELTLFSFSITQRRSITSGPVRADIFSERLQDSNDFIETGQGELPFHRG